MFVDVGWMFPCFVVTLDGMEETFQNFNAQLAEKAKWIIVCDLLNKLLEIAFELIGQFVL